MQLGRMSLYRLKISFGRPLVIRQVTDKAFNAETGAQTLTTQEQVIRRAVSLPVSQFRAALADTGLPYGGHLDRAERRFLIDRRDLKWEPGVGDQIFDGETIIAGARKWIVSEVTEDYESFGGLILLAKSSPNDDQE
jgi:hypothetical protein